MKNVDVKRCGCIKYSVIKRKGVENVKSWGWAHPNIFFDEDD